MSTDNNLLEFIKKQIKVEKQIVDSIDNALVDIQNPPVKGVLKGISLDSVKHAEMYEAAYTLLTKTSTALTQEHLDRQRALIEKHIQLESELIVKIEAILPTVHGETITEDDWWKMLWEDVPFHGAPGGG